jgi:energy-coupling factor transporter ATP-binding protein EcfA2
MSLRRVPGVSAWYAEDHADDDFGPSSSNNIDTLSGINTQRDMGAADSEPKNMGSGCESDFSLDTATGIGIGSSLLEGPVICTPESLSDISDSMTGSLCESRGSSHLGQSLDPSSFEHRANSHESPKSTVEEYYAFIGSRKGAFSVIFQSGALAGVMLAVLGMVCHQWNITPNGASQTTSISTEVSVSEHSQSTLNYQQSWPQPVHRSNSAQLIAESEAARLAVLDGETLDWLKSLRFADATPDEVYVSAEDHFNKTLREPVHIAITGQSGVGKSTLVNTLRGLPPTAQGAAPVSTLQMTGVKVPYNEDGFESPYSPGVIYHDLPGCGTTAVPACGPLYYEAFNMDRFDAFVLVTSGRVEDSDIQMYRELIDRKEHSTTKECKKSERRFTCQQNGGVGRRPVFIARSKMDLDIGQEFEDFFRSPSETLASVRKELEEEFGVVGPTANAVSLAGQMATKSQLPSRVYLLSGRLKDMYKFDFPTLRNDLAASLSTTKRNKFVASMLTYETTMVDARSEAAVDVVHAHALLAGANAGINSIPFLGTAATIGIILSMNEEIGRCFGLAPSQVEDAIGLGTANNVAVVEGLKVASEFSGKFLAAEVMKSTLAQCAGTGGAACGAAMAEVSKFIPVVGAVFSGASTFLSVRYIGLQVITAAEEASSRIYTIIRQHRDFDNLCPPLDSPLHPSHPLYHGDEHLPSSCA